MKHGKTWLHTAVRAHRAQTLHHLQRAQQARTALEDAQLLEQSAIKDLTALHGAWTKWRSAAQTVQGLDTAYQKFHGHLQELHKQAGHRRQGCQDQAQAATDALQRSHFVQRKLEAVSEELDEGRRREMHARDHQITTEAWLLCRVAGSQAELQPETERTIEPAVEPHTPRRIR